MIIFFYLEKSLEKIQKKNKLIFEAILAFKAFFLKNSLNNYLSLQFLSEFRGFFDFNELEFFDILKGVGVLKGFFSSKTRRLILQKDFSLKKLKISIEKFYSETNSGLIVNFSLFWAKSLLEIYWLTCRLMCKNGKFFPDICIGIELLLLFSYRIKEEKLEKNFELKEEDSIHAILGKLLSFFLSDGFLLVFSDTNQIKIF